MKSDKEEWTQEEMLETFANTPHERHSIMVGFAKGLGEGSTFHIPEKYKDEEHYYALGWSLGEILEQILHPKDKDSAIFALSQLAGILTKYTVIGAIVGSMVCFITQGLV